MPERSMGTMHKLFKYSKPRLLRLGPYANHKLLYTLGPTLSYHNLGSY